MGTNCQIECVFKVINTYTNNHGKNSDETMVRQRKCTTSISNKDDIKKINCLPTLAEELKYFRIHNSKHKKELYIRIHLILLIYFGRVVQVFLVAKNSCFTSIKIMKVMQEEIWFFLIVTLANVKSDMKVLSYNKFTYKYPGNGIIFLSQL